MTMGNTPSKSQPMTIVARKVRVDFGPLPLTPLDWYNSDPAVTEFFHALSVHFPAGETFFINSVAHYAEEIKTKDPKLWEQVLLFFKQEGMHTHVHEVWDARIQDEYGHPMDEYEADVALRLENTKSRLPFLSQLALTACLEHFTSSMARFLLDSRTGHIVQQNSAEPHRSLWRWHATEELEHKSVAFDVYTLVGGGYARRCLIMMVVGPLFILRTLHMWWYLIRERKLPVMRSVSRLFQFLFWKPAVLPKVLPDLLHWFYPSYHPMNSEYKRDLEIVSTYSDLLQKKEKFETSGVSESGNEAVLCLEPDPVSQSRTLMAVAPVSAKM